MNPYLSHLQPYPFERLRSLFDGVTPAEKSAISLTIGEPKHPVPAFIKEHLIAALDGIGQYPSTLGIPELREEIATWLCTRFTLSAVNPNTQVLPVSGTREAIFSFTQAIAGHQQNATVVMPNPCYQIYEGATLLAGATPYYMPCNADTNYLPDLRAVPASVWQDCAVLFLCSPNNPTAAVTPLEDLQYAIELSKQYDFVIASDECYSEIYLDEAAPPPGLLQAAQASGHPNFENLVVFHSLSKRSNVPGMRSGFVAGDAKILKEYLRYRTYHGATLSPAVQHASIAAWNDESHVQENRDLYRQKFAAAEQILPNFTAPAASFYVWLPTPTDDADFACTLLREENVRVLPGSYMGREIKGHNPGTNHVRISLVASVDECETALRRIQKHV